MQKNLKTKIIIIIAITVFSIWAFWPPKKKIKLGLDLNGGIHLVLQVDTKKALETELAETIDRVQADLKDKHISFDAVRQAGDYSFQIAGIPNDRQAEVKDYLDTVFQSYDQSKSMEGGKVNWKITMRPAFINDFRRQAVARAKETIDRRVNELGVRESSSQLIEPIGGGFSDKILIQIPGVDDPERAREIIGKTAILELKLVHPEKGGPYNSRQEALQAFNNALPPDYEILPYTSRGSSEPGASRFIVVKKAPAITGKHLKYAEPHVDPDRPANYNVGFTLTNEGKNLFSRVTEENVGKALAIVLDGIVYSFPKIESKISDQARITGNFSAEEARDLALVLRSGTLPAPTPIIEERVVGPSLGLDSIRQGTFASIFGLFLVVLGMVIYYKLSGLNAIAALILNLILLLGAMGLLDATLTLPGIAGIALTIGMAVDTNVLIFERMKEELRQGKTIKSATDTGFKKALRAIIDTHFTTLSAAVVLAIWGTGTIKGFAVTLIIGLLANLFTAYFVSRVIFETLLTWRRIERLSI